MARKSATRHGRSRPLDRLAPFEDDSLIVVIETPKGSPNKMAFEPRYGTFVLKGVLPAGAVFPFDFGFVPSTRAGDGDPLDALVLIDSATFPGCLVRARLLGVILGRQTGRSGRTVDNPRLIAVGTKSNEYDGVRTLRDLPNALVDEIEYFFVSYNAASGKVFKPMGRYGRKGARSVLSSAEASDRKHLRPEVISTLPNSMPGHRWGPLAGSKGDRGAPGPDGGRGGPEDVKGGEAADEPGDGSSQGHRQQR